MSNWIPILEQGMLLSNLSLSGQNNRKSVKENFLTELMVGLIVASYVLIMSGITIYLLKTEDISFVLIINGLIALFTMAILSLVMRVYQRLKRNKIQRAFSDLMRDGSSLAEELGEKAEEIFKDNAGLATVLTALAGFLIARKTI